MSILYRLFVLFSLLLVFLVSINNVCCAIVDPAAMLGPNIEWPFRKGLYSCQQATAPNGLYQLKTAGNCIYDSTFAGLNGYPAIDPITTLNIPRRKVKIGIAAAFGGSQQHTGKYLPTLINMWLEYYTTYSTMMFQGWDIEFGYQDANADTNANIAINATQSLVNWGANIILGAPSIYCIHSMRIAEASKLPMIGYTCGVAPNFICIDGTPANAPCKKANDRRFEWSYAIHHPTTNYMIAAVQLYHLKQVKRIAFLYTNTNPFLGTGLNAIQAAKTLGMNVVYSAAIPVPYGTTAPYTQLIPFVQELIASQPEVVIAAYACIPLITLFKQFNYMPAAAAFTACVDDTGSISTLGEDIRYMLGPTQWDYRLQGPDWMTSARSASTIYRTDLLNYTITGDTPSPLQFSNHFVKFAPTGTAEPGYLEASLMAGITTAEAAIINANSTDPNLLSTALNNMYEQTFWGLTAFNRWGMDSYKPLLTLQIDANIKSQVITPFEYGTKDFLFPMPSWDDRISNTPITNIDIFIIILTVISIVFQIIICILIIRDRNSKEVKASTPSFCLLTLFGGIVMLSSNFAWLENGASNSTCTARVWLVALGFNLMFTPIFIKTYRLWRIFESAKLVANPVTMKQLWTAVIIALCIEIIYLIVWTSTDGMSWNIRIVDISRPALNFPECNLSLVWTWINAGIKCAFLLMGCLLLWLSRNLPPVFNESKQITTVMYMLALSAITVLPILASDNRTDLQTRYLIRALGIILIVLATSSILFIPKLTLSILHTAAQSSVFKGRSWKGESNLSINNTNNISNGGVSKKSVADNNNNRSSIQDKQNNKSADTDINTVEVQLVDTNNGTQANNSV